MGERRWLDIKQWREDGFLQECNRLFFHPHGQALAVRQIGKVGWTDENIANSEWMQARLHDVVEALRPDMEDLPMVVLTNDPEAALREIARPILEALWPAGTEYLHGVYEVVDDPEGVVFGEDPEDKRRRAEIVERARARFRKARAKLFHPRYEHWYLDPTSDIEPIDWVMPEPEATHG